MSGSPSFVQSGGRAKRVLQSLRARHLVVAVERTKECMLCDLGGRVTVQDELM